MKSVVLINYIRKCFEIEYVKGAHMKNSTILQAIQKMSISQLIFSWHEKPWHFMKCQHQHCILKEMRRILSTFSKKLPSKHNNYSWIDFISNFAQNEELCIRKQCNSKSTHPHALQNAQLLIYRINTRFDIIIWLYSRINRRKRIRIPKQPT